MSLFQLVSVHYYFVSSYCQWVVIAWQCHLSTFLWCRLLRIIVSFLMLLHGHTLCQVHKSLSTSLWCHLWCHLEGVGLPEGMDCCKNLWLSAICSLHLCCLLVPHSTCLDIRHQLIVLVFPSSLNDMCWRGLVPSHTIMSLKMLTRNLLFTCQLSSSFLLVGREDGKALLMSLCCPTTPLYDTCVVTYVIISTLTGGT